MNCDLQLKTQSPPSKRKDCGHSPVRTYTVRRYSRLIGSPNAILGGSSEAGRVAFEPE
jgi:hypothetical protein